MMRQRLTDRNVSGAENGTNLEQPPERVENQLGEGRSAKHVEEKRFSENGSMMMNAILRPTVNCKPARLDFDRQGCRKGL